MYPRAFGYLRPSSIQETLTCLAQHGEEASVLAGGMSLIPLMKYRQRSPRLLVDIGRLRELAGVSINSAVLRIGATTRHSEVAAWDADSNIALFPELAGRIGDVQVRNMGTVGGGLAAVEPTGDWGTALLAMRGEVTAVASSGKRRIAADDLFLGSYRSALRPDELLTEAVFPLPEGRYGTAAAKFETRAAAAPLMSCAVLTEFGDDDQVTRAGVACTGLEGFPVRLPGVEALLCGQRFSADLLGDAGEAARTAAGKAFRGAVLASLVRDALRRAAERGLHAGKEAVR